MPRSSASSSAASEASSSDDSSSTAESSAQSATPTVSASASDEEMSTKKNQNQGKNKSNNKNKKGSNNGPAEGHALLSNRGNKGPANAADPPPHTAVDFSGSLLAFPDEEIVADDDANLGALPHAAWWYWVGVYEFDRQRWKGLGRAALGEFLGSILLLFAFTGLYLLPANQVSVSSYLGLSLDFFVFSGLVVSMLTYATVGVSGGHLNPIITLTTMMTGHTNLTRGFVYITVQVVGSLVGALAGRGALGWVDKSDRYEATRQHRCVTGSEGGDLAVRSFVLELMLSCALLFVVFSFSFAPTMAKMWQRRFAPAVLGTSYGVLLFVGRVFAAYDPKLGSSQSSDDSPPYLFLYTFRGNPMLCYAFSMVGMRKEFYGGSEETSIPYRPGSEEGSIKYADWVWALAPLTAAVLFALLWMVLIPRGPSTFVKNVPLIRNERAKMV